MRADEYAILQGDSVVNRNIILYFDVISDRDTGIDIYPLADNTIPADLSAFTHLGLMPDAASFPNLGFLGYVSAWMNPNSHL
jgi:hypothetical protein